MDIELLEGAGLTRIEAKVYLTMLELGSALAGEITAKSGVHRRCVYDSINRLVEKGLVSYIKTNNRKYFEAAKPERLLGIIDEKKEGINKLMPELNLMHDMAKEEKETLLFKGKQGLKTVFDDQIKEGKEILLWGASTAASDILKYYFPHFDRERARKGINVKIIFDEEARKADYVKKIPLSQVKYLPKEYKSPACTNIYGSKVSIVLWSDNPVAIVINQKEIAEGYRRYFDLMWKIAKK